MRARRTQAERREATVGKLVQATIDSLAKDGYARTSVAAICRRADLSQGALFRHFPTRLHLVAAATDAIAQRNVRTFETAFAEELDLEAAVRFIRAAARTPQHAAWHEVMVAARTDPGLRDAVAGGLRRFEEAIVAIVDRVFGAQIADSGHAAVVLLTLMHAFDSEAVTVDVYPNPAIEEARVAWAVSVLRQVLGLTHSG